MTQFTKKSLKWLQNGPQGEPKIHLKSIKILVWTPRCPIGGPWESPGHPNGATGSQNGAPGHPNGAKMEPQGTKMWCSGLGLWPYSRTLHSTTNQTWKSFHSLTNSLQPTACSWQPTACNFIFQPTTIGDASTCSLAAYDKQLRGGRRQGRSLKIYNIYIYIYIGDIEGKHHFYKQLAQGNLINRTSE